MMHADVHVFLLQLCHINNRIVSLAQRMSALEEHIEQLNDRMKDLEEKLEDNNLLLRESNRLPLMKTLIKILILIP